MNSLLTFYKQEYLSLGHLRQKCFDPRRFRQGFVSVKSFFKVDHGDEFCFLSLCPICKTLTQIVIKMIKEEKNVRHKMTLILSKISCSSLIPEPNHWPVGKTVHCQAQLDRKSVYLKSHWPLHDVCEDLVSVLKERVQSSS